MKVLIFTDVNGTVNVKYKTDLVSDDQSNFTIMSIEGLDDAEKKIGLNFKQMPHTINGMKAFAQAKFLKLQILDLAKNSTTTLIDYTTYGGGGLGLDGI